MECRGIPFLCEIFRYVFEIKHLVFIKNSIFWRRSFITALCFAVDTFSLFLHEGCCKRVNQPVLEPFTALIRPRIAIDRKNEILKNLNFEDV